MADDRRSADDAAEDELELRRRRRFGKLPKRISPTEMVEMVESEPARETHEPIEPRREWA